MLNIGKAIRMERIMDRNTGKTVIVPMDHGVTVGPIPGIINLTDSVNQVAEGGANAVLGHIGLPKYGHRHGGKDIGLILHLSASTALSPRPNRKVIVNTVRELAKLNPQNHVHASELYAAVNVVMRCPPGPMLALLASRPWFIHVGDLHYRLSDSDTIFED